MRLAAAEQMRELDRSAIETAGVPSLVLMEHAAEALAEAALLLLDRRPGKSRGAVFCGTGNNGGDGLAAARILRGKGLPVRVFLVGDRAKLTPDARENVRRLEECGVEAEPFDPENRGQAVWARGADVVLDALFGVGLSREIAPESVYAAAVELMNRCRGRVLSADIPSGVEADTGRVLGCAVRADWTVTFTAAKIGHAVDAGALLSGHVETADIGIPKKLSRALVCPVQTVEADFVAAALPRRRPDGHKGTFGKLLIIGGAEGYTGAPYLTASAAVHAGCGLVTLGVPETVWAVEAVKCTSAMAVPLHGKPGAGYLDRKALPEIRKRIEGCDVLALGPGLGRHRETVRLVLDLLARTEKPVVLDADGINALEGHIDVLDKRRGRVTILTPHDVEFTRAGGDLSRGRVQGAQDFAHKHGCVLVLKGHRTVTAAPQGTALVNTTGGSGLAKGGSGDVLTGLIASLLCQGAAPVQAAAGGVWIHGRAGDLAEAALSAYACTPADVISALPEVFRELSEEPE